MWIEGIEFTGFGNLSKQKIKFAKDKINLVVENNEYGKSTIAEAIWAVLFDYPLKKKATEDKLKARDIKKPANGQPFKACLDLVLNNRSLRLVRNFSEKTLKVFDRSKGDIEVTQEFLSSSSQDEAGYRLLGLERELFKSTCFVGQGDLNENMLDDDHDLCSHLQSIADSSGNSATSAEAIACLEETLNKFPYQGKKQRLERIIRDLEDKQNELRSQISEFEQERELIKDDLDKLDTLNSSIEKQEHDIKAREYLKLCLDLADIDQRLANTQEKLTEADDLRQQQEHLHAVKDFPIERSKYVEELWSKREARLADFNRLKSDIDENELHLKGKNLELKERCHGVSNFSIDDVYNISALSKTLQTALSELSETQKKKSAELSRVKETGVEIDNLAAARKVLLNLNAKDIDNAYACNAMVKSAHLQINEDERSLWRARMILVEIEEQRKIDTSKYKQKALLFGIFTVIAVVILMFFVLGLQGKWQFPLIAAGIVMLAAVLAVFCVQCISIVSVKNYRKQDAQKSEEIIAQSETIDKENRDKIVELNVRLDGLARKAGVTDGNELVKIIESYASSSAQLKDLDLLEHMTSSRNEHILQLKEDLEKYFVKADKKIDEITPELANSLTDEINQYLEAARTLDSSADVLEHRRGELKFLSGELLDTNALLRDHFVHANIYNDDIDKSYYEFMEKVADYRKLESVESSLSRIKQDFLSDAVSDDFSSVLQKLQTRREFTWARMEDLINRYPEVADMPPPPELDDVTISALEDKLRRLQEEYGELKIKTGSTSRNYDEHYLETQEELESVSTQAKKLYKTKQALELARDLFKQLSEETHAHWSSRLNDISKEMLEVVGGDFESLHFDNNLRLTARRKGQSEPLQPAQINTQLSVGTREQIHWLARMAVSKFLSAEESLPIILDEPFSEADDDRFARMMSFLIDSVLPQHQIILFSCHQVRHRQLSERLNETQRNLLEYSKLEQI